MSETHELVFDWPPRKISFLLAGFLFLSLLIHLFGFYLFQIVYPPSVSIAPPAAQLVMLDPRNPEQLALLRWIDAEDPARSAAPLTVSPPGLLDPHYVPSYEAGGTQPKLLPVTEAPVPFPEAKTAAEMFESMAARAQAAPKPVDPPATEIRFSRALSSRQPKPLPSLTLEPVRDLDATPTTLMVGVIADGQVRYIFEQASSGNTSLDLAARRHIGSIRFSSAAEPVVWGFVTYRWGSDAFASPARPTDKP